ncbi:MAG: iron-sulfur cluster repair di-iron protein, ric [Eubacteriales bacterium]|nr:iron-sulfur cluster repair di-iron protein, ric [Eubacteriales bacterium]
MNEQATFDQVKKNHLKLLGQYVPVVDKVHGKNHPEFHEVRALAEDILRKAATAGKEKPRLDQEFARLREVTQNYQVPDDVCESYEAVYNMLSELDQGYYA